MARLLLTGKVVQVNLDLVDHQVPIDFKGFTGLMPGYHHVWIKQGGTQARCVGDVVLATDRDVTALRIDDVHGLVPDQTLEGWDRIDAAKTGKLDDDLVDLQEGHARAGHDWHTATWTLEGPVVQVPLAVGSRPRVVRGELRELQAAFVRMTLRHDTLGRARFAELVRGFSALPASGFFGALDLLQDLAESLTAMLALAPALFAGDSDEAGAWIEALARRLDSLGRSDSEGLLPLAAELREAWGGATR